MVSIIFITISLITLFITLSFILLIGTIAFKIEDYLKSIGEVKK